MSVRPEKTGSIMPIIPGSITPIGDTQMVTADMVPENSGI
jgi:hypothetical protein